MNLVFDIYKIKTQYGEAVNHLYSAGWDNLNHAHYAVECYYNYDRGVGYFNTEYEIREYYVKKYTWESRW